MQLPAQRQTARRSNRSRRVLPALLLPAALALSACSAVEDAASGVANTATCAAVEELGGQLDQLVTDAAAGASAADLRVTSGAITAASEAVAGAASLVDPALGDTLRDAGAAFESAVADVPTDAADAAADTAVGAAAQGYSEALQGVLSDLGC